MLILEGVCFGYTHRRVLTNIDLTLRPGDHLCLLGNNGAGKSTLLRLCAGILLPAAGAIRLEGRPLSAWRRPEVARRLAYLPQEAGQTFAFTALEVVLMGRYARARSFYEDAADLHAAEQAMRRMDCWHLHERPFSELSGGERRRVLLAQVLAQDTPVVLLDEPTAGLDLAHALQLGAALADIAGGGRALLWTTHDFNLAARFSPQALLLHDGQLRLRGATWEVLAQTSAIIGVPLHLGRLPSGAPFVVPT